MTLPEGLSMRWYNYFDPANEAIARQQATLWNRCLCEVGGDASYQSTYEADMAEGDPQPQGRVQESQVVLDGNTVVAAGLFMHADRSTVSETTHAICVDPEWRRRGIGSHLLADQTAKAKAKGADRMSCWLITETGRIPLGELFCAARGFAEADLERMQALKLPVTPELLTSLDADAARGSGEDYEVMVVVDDLREEWLADLVILNRRMSTDAPQSIERPESTVTADQLSERWQALRRSGTTQVLAVAVAKAVGALVGMSGLTVRPRQTSATQGDTLVLREHRGNRLGLALKLATARALSAARPDVDRIITSNHVINAPMLTINEAIGFVETARCGNWCRDL